MKSDSIKSVTTQLPFKRKNIFIILNDTCTKNKSNQSSFYLS